MTFSDIESELRKLPNLTQYHQKSYMTFSDVTLRWVDIGMGDFPNMARIIWHNIT